MYMEIQEGFIKQIYNGMRDEFPLIFDLDENDIIKEFRQLHKLEFNEWRFLL